MSLKLTHAFIFLCLNFILLIHENYASLRDFTELKRQHFKYAGEFKEEPEWLQKIKDSTDKDIDLDPSEMITQSGYQAMSYDVVTEDGYILTVYRIPPTKPGLGNGHPVMLQHGFIASAADWILSGPGKALAYLLADLGYDVWLGNCRGNTYSRAHMNLSTSQKEFWNFTFHEMGYYDLPAVTAFILKNSNDTQLTYIGHSMGTTMFFVFCTTRPDLQHRIKQMHALAPIAFVMNMKSPMRYAAPGVQELKFLLDFNHQYEFLRHGGPVGFIVKAIFGRGFWPANVAAEEVLFLLCGTSRQEFNQALLPYMIGHSPAGTSVLTAIHFLQEIKSGFFRQFDEGSESKNIKRYGNFEPPEYNLSLITVPIALHYSDNDYLAAVQDVKELHSRLKSSMGLFRVPLESFNHLDFTFGNDADKLVYKTVIDLMTKKTDTSGESGELRKHMNIVTSVLRSRFASILSTLGSELIQLKGRQLQEDFDNSQILDAAEFLDTTSSTDELTTTEDFKRH